MINNGYSLDVKDFAAFHEFKKSSAYGLYLKSISNSPAFKTIMNEHINNVDVTEDVKKLKNDGKLPDSISAKALSDLFKQSLNRMAICITADAVILKELEDNKIEEVLESLTDDSDITYLLGKADPQYYEQASRMVEEGKLDKNSLAFKGLTSYLKQTGKLKGVTKPLEKATPVKTIEKPNKAEAKKEINFDSNSIDL
jgi:hypothetical protein